MGGDRQREAVSNRADRDSDSETDPHSPFWQTAPALFMAQDVYGIEVPGHRTEVRSRWTETNLYFLFVCPYLQLHLKPAPDLNAKTEGLWNWDVAEVFIGSFGEAIHKYKEFEMSPQGEWLDIDVDLSRPDKLAAGYWRSGFQVAARIDATQHVWYGAMRIPYASIDNARPGPGKVLRVNFFRSQGPNAIEVAWQPPLQPSFHAPQHFGTLRLIR